MHIELMRHLAADLASFDLLADIRFARSAKHAAAILLWRDIVRKDASLRGVGCADAAELQWRAMNHRCLASSDGFSTSARTAAVLHRARQLLDSWIPTPNFTFTVRPEDGSFGPGATLLHKSTSLNSKLIDAVHSYTDADNVSFYLKALTSLTACETELTRQERKKHVRVQGAKFQTVPKDEKTDRAICIEPLLNLFKQQAIRRSLERLLKARVNIDLSNQQEVQKSMAKQASVDGRFSTIDLTSASDTVSVGLCEWLLPYGLLEELKIARSPSTSIRGQFVQNHMISSMGNATTFPLQTFIFCALATAATELSNVQPRHRGKGRNIGVFGDDIIVENVVFPLLFDALVDCGFIPNGKKCFHLGAFRESCGGDYFAGTSVSPVRLKTGWSPASITSLVNRLVVWSVEHGIIIEETIKFLLPKCRANYVPPYEAADSGVWSHFTSARKYISYVPRQRRVRQPRVSLCAVLAGSIVDNEFAIERSRATSYRAKRRVAVCVPHHRLELGNLPAPVTSLLTVPYNTWCLFLELYKIPHQ